MAAIVWTDVTAAAPQLTTVSATTQADILAFVNAALNLVVFDGESGPRTRLARINLAAHFAELERLGAGGPVIAESDGRLSRQYAMPPSRSEFLTTSYGRAFWLLISPAAFGPRLA
jgi:hypothetical protein